MIPLTAEEAAAGEKYIIIFLKALLNMNINSFCQAYSVVINVAYHFNWEEPRYPLCNSSDTKDDSCTESSNFCMCWVMRPPFTLSTM